MIILLEESKYTDITLSSAKQFLSDQATLIVTDNADLFLDENPDLLGPVFMIRGTSVKIFNHMFEHHAREQIKQGIGYFSIGKKYPGAYFRKSYGRAYELDGIPNYATVFDTDVMLIDPVMYCKHRHDDVLTMKEKSDVTLMCYNLNSKDDYLMTHIMDPYDMLKQNVWSHCCAGLINFSESIIHQDDVESCVLMPFDLLYSHSANTDIHKVVTHKQQKSESLFGKIKQEMVRHWKTKIS